MKSREKGEKGVSEKQLNLGEKLRKVGKRGGHSTPVLPFWSVHHQQLQDSEHCPFSLTGSASFHPCQSGGAAPCGGFVGGGGRAPAVSARKLAATLWELDHYKLPLSRMHHQHRHAPPARIRRLHHPDPDPDPSPSSPELPESASSLRRHVALLMRHHHPIERNHRALQPVSPASYDSSLEIAPYNPAITPSSSAGFKGRVGEPGYSLKTSTELLKVLNRIWSLEEQHASNVSLVRAMKKELDHSRARIKELVRGQQADRHEMDEMMKQIAEDKLAKKSKEQDRVNMAFQSARAELEDERKLRKHSESLHRKLARELNEVKAAFGTALKELEHEKRSRLLLEELCDEFAWGIRESEQEVHALRQKFDKDKDSGHDRLVLHMSESWLDERMQMKIEPQTDPRGWTSIVDKMSSEILAFLQVQKNEKSNSHFSKKPLESTPQKVAASAPQHEDDEEDSAGSDSHCFELHKPSADDLKPRENVIKESHNNGTTKQSRARKKLPFDDKAKSHLQMNFEDQGSNLVDISISKKTEISETAEGNPVRITTKDGTPELNSRHMIDNLIRNHYLLSESMSMHPENDHELASGGSSVWRSRPSPVRPWTETLPPQELEISESSSKPPTELKENTLKSKLMEARARGQRSRSRLKGSKISFVG